MKNIAELTQLNNGLKIILPSGRDRLVFICGEVRRCNYIIYCIDNDRINSESSLLDLSDTCLEKIISLLDADSQCVLYNSCTRTQILVGAYISSHVFYVTHTIKENVFQSLGKHISRIYLKNIFETEDLWRNINRHCSAITELAADGYSLFHTDNQTRFIWPNLKKLVGSVHPNFNYQKLRSFVCPMLEHLKIHDLGANGVQQNVEFDHEDEYSHLTTLHM